MSGASAIRVGDWTAVRSTGQLRRGDLTLHLEPRVVEVLFALAETPNQVVTLAKLMDAAWGDADVAIANVEKARTRLKAIGAP